MKSVLLFLCAAALEIGGGYLVWLGRREQRPIWFGILGFLFGWTSLSA